jgi:hypothetical protein
MSYLKLTLAVFTENLNAGKYETLAGARRALGKVGWSNADKERGQALASKHFGDSGETKVAKKAAKKAAKAAAPKKESKKASVKATRSPAKSPSFAKFAKTRDLSQEHAIIVSCTGALHALLQAKKQEPAIDISEIQDVTSLISKTIRSVDQAMNFTLSDEVRLIRTTNEVTPPYANGSSAADEAFPKSSNPG